MAPAMTDRIKLAVEDVSKTFRVRGEPGEKDSLLSVLRHVSFAVAENEIVSLVGESGCGKTTLLRIVQGLVRLDRGTIRIDGREVRGPGRDRGFVFQQPNLLPWRTAINNVELGLELQGVAAGGGREERRAGRRRSACWPLSAFRLRRASFPTSCPAGCSSASALPARSPSTPRCC
jgi:ABC-type nitrate/sulfonate/bicarbonate transport system ATPase subunit